MQDKSAAATENAPLRQRIHAETIDQLYRQSRLMQLLTLLNSGFLVYLLWEVIAHEILLTWLTLLVTLTLARSLLGYRYFNRNQRGNESLWAARYTLGALIAGISWGSAGILLYPPDETAYQAILFFLLTGMGAGAYVANTSYLTAFYAFFIPTLVPVIIRFFLDSDKLHITIGLWGIVFFLSFLYFARKAHYEQIEAFRLRLHNQLLLDELVLRHNAAEQANLSKTKFLAAASHDLRQPLFALGLYTEMLESETDINKIREISTLIKQSFFSLKGLLDALLDISRLDAGVVKVHKESFHLQEVFDRILVDYAPMAIDKNITLRIVPTTAVVYSDPSLVERILRNLVSNAINYTQEGAVLVGLKRTGNHYTVRVCDSGIGIPQSELGNIFQEFHQLANPERDREKGIGLGLSIVKRLLELLEENIVVNSAPGQGTSVFVSLQQSNKSVPAAIISEQAPEVIGGASILIIEDDHEVCRSMHAFLEGLGHRVLSADSEDEALRLLLRERVEPDLIISDYRLRNDQNGVAAAEAVITYLDKKLPVMIITGDTAPERIREANSHGYRLLHKPIAPQELKLAVAQMLTGDKAS